MRTLDSVKNTLLCLVFLSLTLFGCGTQGAQSGISGKVLLSPNCPSVGPGMEQECQPKPYRATIVVTSEDGSREIARISTSEAGEFKATLRPGTYRLDPVPGGEPYPFAKGQIVRVEEGKYTEVKIMYDSGVR